MLSKLTARQG